ncbi:MAG: cation:proton antiporter, partial [Wujia sp.]
MDLNVLTYLGIMLLAALVAGKIVKQMKLPNVTGYLVIGLLLGPHCIGILSEELVDSMDLLTELALG